MECEKRSVWSCFDRTFCFVPRHSCFRIILRIPNMLKSCCCVLKKQQTATCFQQGFRVPNKKHVEIMLFSTWFERRECGKGMCSLWKKWCTAYHPCTTENFTHSLDIPKENVTFKKAATNPHLPQKSSSTHHIEQAIHHNPQGRSHKLTTHIKSTVRVSTGYSVIKLFNLYYCATQCIGLHSSIAWGICVKASPGNE